MDFIHILNVHTVSINLGVFNEFLKYYRRQPLSKL